MERSFARLKVACAYADGGVEDILSSQAGGWEKESLCAAERHLRRSLHTYRALRAFLGYKGKTKMERRALELLDRGT